DIDPDPTSGGGAGSSGAAHAPGHAPYGHSLNPNGSGIESSGVGGGGIGANVPGAAGGGIGGQGPLPTGFEGSYTQPGAPLPPGASPPTHHIYPVIVPVGARRRESGHGQPGVLNTVPTPWFDPNHHQQYHPQQPWSNADPFSYSSGPSGQYGVGTAAGWVDPAYSFAQRRQSMGRPYSPNDPFATPSGQQGHYGVSPRDSNASYFDPRASGADYPAANLAAAASASQPTSDEKANLIAINSSRTNSTSPSMTTYLLSTPGHGPLPSLPSTKPESSSTSPQPAAAPTTTTTAPGSPEVRPMSTAEASAAPNDPFETSNNNNTEAEGHQDPPPPSYAEAERSRSMDSSATRQV
ncbi:hypothetical protein FRC00_010994, partial [Tulasnella sp. 408]